MNRIMKIGLFSIISSIIITLLTGLYATAQGKGFPGWWLMYECGGQSCYGPVFIYQSFLIDFILWALLVFLVVSLSVWIRKQNVNKKTLLFYRARSKAQRAVISATFADMKYQKAIIYSILAGIVIAFLTFFYSSACLGSCPPPYNNSNNYEGFPLGWLSIGGTAVTVPPHSFPSQVYWLYLFLDIVIWSFIVLIARLAYTGRKRKIKNKRIR
jgi:hypothetical protein